ncbi:MAG: hypothetical protein AB1456_04015 [Thermodesulfobacteriota bacterium]
MQCQSCRKEVALAGRVGFREECPHCGADLHSCVHCRFYDRGASNECRESSAERVGDKEKANRCDYFQPAEGAVAGTTDDARARLEALFKK